MAHTNEPRERRPNTRLWFVASMLACVGCDGHTTADNHVAPVEKKIVADDATAVRECVTGWLDSQKRTHRGEVFLDPYVTMPLDTPNQNEYTKYKASVVKTIRDSEDFRMNSDIRHALAGEQPFEVKDHSKLYYQETIDEVDDIYCVRQWEVIDVELIDLTKKEQGDFGRQRRASVNVRIESSKTDGTPIIKVWTIRLFKNEGKWGIYSAS